VQGLGIVHEISQLIPPKIVASNVTSQFRLLVLEDACVVEIQRTGRGWGRDLTVAAVVFREEAAFSSFMEAGSFDAVKKDLAESVLRQREVIFRSDSPQVTIDTSN
jgi:hypothetical protein